MAGRRVNLSELADEPPLEDARVPSFAAEATQRTARLDQVAPNPLNTRDVHADSAKIASIAESMRTHGQLQPCAVVTRAAFLGAFPEYETAIGSAAFVQVMGGRRRAAAVQAGLPTLDITVKNNLAASRAQFISATAAENIERESLDPIEEARAVQLLVKECGTGKAVAEQLGRTPGWVTQRLNLLKLAPAVQEALRGDEESRIPLREVRDLHNLSVDDQLAALEAWRKRNETSESATADADAEGAPQSTEAGSARPRRSPAAAAIRRLGGTPPKIAEALRAELDPADLKALIELLLLELS